ncbi:transglycosylase domain-containing protein [Lactobacillus terrae]|uniref:transglycosylase domain-containing protein n=1 Tax=Lactobacillus terrae TaxID=2269374 RepID=UPI000C1B6E8B|nr:transglycosylase domain-containing protein [Lactobacillus terrae]
MKTTNYWKKGLKYFGIFIALCIVIFLSVFTYYAFKSPTVTKEDLQSGGSSVIVDTSGKQIVSLGNSKRNYVTIDKVPKQMQNAVVSIEDKQFYNETFGINPVRIVKSVFNNAFGDDGLQGGSTLTQQLIKLTAFSTDVKDQTYKRKLQEAWLAIKLSQQYSKDQILEYYVNKVYMSNGVYGIQTASKYYYGKSLDELTLPQQALLAGLPNAPSSYDPYKHPDKAKERRDLVIRAMYNNNKISKSQAQEAIATPIDSGMRAYHNIQSSDDNNRMITDPYVKEAITEVQKKGYDPYRDNLKITVNMDYDAQKRLYNIVNSSNYVQFQDSKMQVGASIVNPNNGKVIAMIGGRNLQNIQFGLNRAVQTSRSNGSTIKPVLDYAPAIEYLNWSTYHQLDDSKYTYPGTDIVLGDWDNTYQGQMSMREALVGSRNVPAVKTLQSVGFSKAINFASNMGIDVSNSQGLSAGIGANASSLQGASAYSAFANGGTYYKPTYVSKIETADGIVHNYSSKAKKVMKNSTAYMITDMLKGVPSSTGFASYAQISGIHQAGKTGTTNYSDDEISSNYALSGKSKDAWYNGYTKDYSMSVWTGYDSPNSEGVSSTYQSVAGKIYKAEMEYLYNDKTSSNWKKPSSVVSMRIQNNGSKTPTVAPPGSSNYTKELFIEGYEPSNPYSESGYPSQSSTTVSGNEVVTNRRSSDNSTSDSETTTDDSQNGNTDTGTGSTGNNNGNTGTGNTGGGNNNTGGTGTGTGGGGTTTPPTN